MGLGVHGLAFDLHGPGRNVGDVIPNQKLYLFPVRLPKVGRFAGPPNKIISLINTSHADGHDRWCRLEQIGIKPATQCVIVHLSLEIRRTVSVSCNDSNRPVRAVLKLIRNVTSRQQVLSTSGVGNPVLVRMVEVLDFPRRGCGQSNNVRRNA